MMAAPAVGPGLVVHGGTLATVADTARRAEASGLGSVWTTEFYDRSASISLAAMAQATTSITIGSAIMYAVGRSPLVLATEARDLAELAGGRLVLGLGTGTRRMQADWHGADPTSPAPRVEELVPLLRSIWQMDEEGVRHDGRFYRLHLVPTGYPPTPRRIPVYLGGVNPRMLTAAGRVADGLVGHPIYTPRYVEEVVRPTLGAAATDVGRDEPASIAGYIICAVDDDGAAARRDAKAQIAFYSVVKTYGVVLRLHGFESQVAEIREAWSQRDHERMVSAVTDEMLETIAIAGTPEEARDQYAANFQGVYEQPLLYSPSFGLSAGRLEGNLAAIMDTFGSDRS